MMSPRTKFILTSSSVFIASFAVYFIANSSEDLGVLPQDVQQDIAQVFDTEKISDFIDNEIVTIGGLFEAEEAERKTESNQELATEEPKTRESIMAEVKAEAEEEYLSFLPTGKEVDVLAPAQAQQLLVQLMQQRSVEKTHFTKKIDMQRRQQQILKVKINQTEEPSERMQLVKRYSEGQARLSYTQGQWGKRQMDVNRRLQQLRQNLAQNSNTYPKL